ncbi:MAG: phosphoribosylformylglycinamidine synthase I [Candidatus Peribacter sp.]|nr:phosphoribosylformylglycinamidine synthase I [Candidatus Peribacter sp.]MBT4392440.1 phosphoribosylformylglycinamidine synthase I [Candidatus Peribacter sp.]MBT4601230.1 phosphoribosylformylglycinamidine synthase I [Candidatus Peribacter sp.]MBT5149279.1 phosphoribosylformylglycinamidine synthase I [Candidatus Peribacter sp.]MBT5637103.1 phosphoribosylformylglycinamidine synthase I [Candidatus Peribacter sp.]
MKTPRIAIVSFPGNNCEVESMRAIRNAGMEAVYFRWNDDVSRLKDIDGYFIPGGFSYEDRGRAGMISARDPILEFIKEEAAKGKVVIGNCNGAQVLIESGLVPNAQGLQMSLAHNAVDGEATGFLSEWIWCTPSCAQDRCATSDWTGAMHMPIAHGEGRFTTTDKALYEGLKSNSQIAFQYCDEEGNISEEVSVTPNGSEYAIAGICNPEGNVVALMPHPERTPKGDPYFASMKKWIESHPVDDSKSVVKSNNSSTVEVPQRDAQGVEIFIETIIVNNEERTVEQAARRLLKNISLKQMKYFSLTGDPQEVLGTISLFNANKEKAAIRRGSEFFTWDAGNKKEVPLEVNRDQVVLLRRNTPDTGAAHLEKGSQTGVCYLCSGVSKEELCKADVLEIFGNPHSSTLELL